MRRADGKKILYVVLFLALLVLGAYLRWAATDLDRTIAPGSDGGVYYYGALNLIEYGEITSDRYGQMHSGAIPAQPASDLAPGFPALIALWMLLSGERSVRALLLVQLGISMLSLALIGCIARRLGLRRPFALPALQKTAWTHSLFVCPALILTPLFYRRFPGILRAVAALPLLATLAQLFYHGLPRYMCFTVPCVILCGAYMLQLLADAIAARRAATPIAAARRTGVRRRALALAGCLWLLIGIYVQPFAEDGEMSASYIARAFGDRADISAPSTPELTASYTLASPQLTLSGLWTDGASTLRGGSDAHGLLFLRDIPTREEETGRTLTKLTLELRTARLFDHVVVYWKENGTEYSEDAVYDPASSFLKSRYTLRIPADVTELMILPVRTRGLSCRIDGITVEKFDVSP